MTYLKYFESKSFIEDYNYNLFKNDSIVLMNKKELITIINIINKLGLLKDYEYIDHINYLNKSFLNILYFLFFKLLNHLLIFNFLI